MFEKYCVVFQELFVVFADMGHRTLADRAHIINSKWPPQNTNVMGNSPGPYMWVTGPVTTKWTDKLTSHQNSSMSLFFIAVVYS